MMFMLNLIKTSLPRIIPASKPCRYLPGNFLNSFLGWVNEKAPPPSIPLKHHLEAISAAMASVHFSTSLLQVWSRPQCDWFTTRYAHSQGLLCSLVLTFQSSSWTTSEKLLGCQSNSIWLQSSEFFFFFNCWKKCSPERGCHPLPLLAPARPTLIFILSRRNLPLLSSRVSFLIPFSSFRSPYTLQRFRVLEWNYIIMPPLTDIIKKYIYLFILVYCVLVVACGIFSCSM